MAKTSNRVECLIDIFTTELVRVLDRFQDLDTAIEIYRITDRAIKSLIELQTQAKEMIRLRVEQAGVSRLETDQATIGLSFSYHTDESAWKAACEEMVICNDAQKRLRFNQIRVEKLQDEYLIRVVRPDVVIKLK